MFGGAIARLNILCTSQLNPFTAEVAIMRLLGSAPISHLCDKKRRSKVTGLSDLMTLFIDLGGLYWKQMQRAFNVFKNTLNWLKIDSVDQNLYWLECGNFSQDGGTPGTERVIVFSQLAVKALSKPNFMEFHGEFHEFTERFSPGRVNHASEPARAPPELYTNVYYRRNCSFISMQVATEPIAGCIH
jgi:hypothetical protein